MNEFKELKRRCGVSTRWLEQIAGLSYNSLANWLNDKRSKPYKTNKDFEKAHNFMQELTAQTEALIDKHGYKKLCDRIKEEELNK